jgi:putative phosphoesterase
MSTTITIKTLILSDIHANLPALKAILACEGSWDDVICLGDAVVAGPQPDEVLDLLSELRATCVMGNHDREVLQVNVDAPVSDPHWQWIQWTREQLSSRNYDLLASFPDTCVLKSQGLTMRLTHGVLPPKWDKRLWPDSNPEAFESLAGQYPEPYILLGHSHVQFRLIRAGRTFFNPGTVGAPYLGQPLACYGVLQDGAFELRATTYDAEETCRAMDDVPLEDQQFVEEWKTCWRKGKLPERYDIRDYTPLIEMGYR